MPKFETRPVEFLGLREHGDWRLKLYSIVYRGLQFDASEFEPGLQGALSELPVPDPGAGRPGLGFAVAHRGVTGDYLVLGWWNHENELPVVVWVRRTGEDWRPAIDGESFCVWDLEILWAERQIWIATMLTDEAPDAYLSTLATDRPSH